MRSIGEGLKAKFLIFVLLTIFGTQASAQITVYDYPELSSDLATICSPAIHVPESESDDLDVEVIKSKGRLRRSKLDLRFYPAEGPEAAKRQNEIVIVLSGLGSEANSVFSKFYAQKAQESGFNVLVFPNTLTRNFIKSSSTRGLVGETPADAVDLLRAIKASLVKVQKKKNVNPTSIKLIGFSHGALLAAAVDSLNQSVHELPIRTVMMVNTPVSLLDGLRNLDARAKAAKKIPFPRLIKLGLRFMKMVKKRTIEPTTIDTFRKFSDDLRYTPEEQYAMIGLAMKAGLDRTILASQEVEDLGVLPELSPEGSAVRRQEEAALRRYARRFSFEGYINTFFGKRAELEREPYDIYALEQRASLPAYESYLRNSKHTFLIHNMDDILLRPGDAEWLQDVFKNRVKFFPRGGHMGNVWFKDNLKAYQDWLLI